MREILKLGGKLLLIATFAGLALGVTNAVTAGPIVEQQIAAANAARKAVLPEAVDFEQADCSDETIDSIYIAKDAGGNCVGYTGTKTVTGYGGPIEVTVGVAKDGKITGVNVGGSDFSETAGLGAKTKDAKFTDGFKGLDSSAESSLYVKQDGGEVDAVTSATISSRAVTGGVRAICTYLQSCMTEGK